MTTQAPGIFEALLAAILADTASRNRNSDLLERVVAGQQAAIDKIEAPKAARTRKADAPTEPAATQETSSGPAAEPVSGPAAEPVVEPAAASTGRNISDDDVKGAALNWMKQVDPTGQDIPKRTECAQWLTSIVASFGLTGKLTGADSVLDDVQRKKARHFILRKTLDLPVDFAGAYDFETDPVAPAAAVEDPLG